MLSVIIIALICIIAFLTYKLSNKQQLETKEKEQLEKEIKQLSIQHAKLEENIKKDVENVNKLHEQMTKSAKQFSQNNANIQNHFSQLRKKRSEEIEQQISALKEEKQRTLALELKQLQETCAIRVMEATSKADKRVEQINQRVSNLATNILNWEQEYNNLLAPLRLLEKEKMQHLFFTVQIPEQYRQDIQYLLTSVSPQVKHPDIINKLIWQEYVKPYLDQTFKRINIKDQSGIYKITNIDNKKSYIGKSTNVKKRIADHFKGAVGIQTIADQTVHHQMRKLGLWNWMIEVIGYFPKDQLSQKQKFYIDKFKAIQYGYNRNSGG